MKAVAAVALLAVVAAGCGTSAAPKPGLTAPPPAAGFSRVIGDGFTIDMPVGWQQPPVDPASFDRAAAELQAQNPNLAKALELARASMGNGSRLFAIDPVDGSTANLIVVDANGRSLTAVVNDASSQLRQAGATAIADQSATVGSLPARRLQFSLSVTGTGGTLTVPETQIYVLRSGRLFILTLFGGNPTLSTVADSLRIA